MACPLILLVFKEHFGFQNEMFHRGTCEWPSKLAKATKGSHGGMAFTRSKAWRIAVNLKFQVRSAKKTTWECSNNLEFPVCFNFEIIHLPMFLNQNVWGLTFDLAGLECRQGCQQCFDVLQLVSCCQCPEGSCSKGQGGRSKDLPHKDAEMREIFGVTSMTIFMHNHVQCQPKQYNLIYVV